MRGDLFRCARRDDPPAAGSALRSQIDHVVGRLDHVEIVLDDDDRVALIDQLHQDVEQLARVFEMQTGRRFVQDVKGTAGTAF